MRRRKNYQRAYPGGGGCLVILLFILAISGCAVKAIRQGDFMELSGWGGKRAEWTDDKGNKFVIEKSEPIKVPDLLPLRGD